MSVTKILIACHLVALVATLVFKLHVFGIKKNKKKKKNKGENGSEGTTQMTPEIHLLRTPTALARKGGSGGTGEGACVHSYATQEFYFVISFNTSPP